MSILPTAMSIIAILSGIKCESEVFTLRRKDWYDGFLVVEKFYQHFDAWKRTVKQENKSVTDLDAYQSYVTYDKELCETEKIVFRIMVDDLEARFGKKTVAKHITIDYKNFSNLFLSTIRFYLEDPYSKNELAVFLRKHYASKDYKNINKRECLADFFVCKKQVFDKIRSELKSHNTDKDAYDARYKKGKMAFCDVGEGLIGQSEEDFIDKFCEMIVDETMSNN